MVCKRSTSCWARPTSAKGPTGAVRRNDSSWEPPLSAASSAAFPVGAKLTAYGCGSAAYAIDRTRLEAVASRNDPSREYGRAVRRGIWRGKAKTLKIGATRARYRGISERAECYGDEGTTGGSRATAMAARNGEDHGACAKGSRPRGVYPEVPRPRRCQVGRSWYDPGITLRRGGAA